MFWLLFACLQDMPSTRDDYWDIIEGEGKEDDKQRGEEQIDETQFSSSLLGTICALGYCEVVKCEFCELLSSMKIVTLRVLTGMECHGLNSLGSLRFIAAKNLAKRTSETQLLAAVLPHFWAKRLSL
jgi:hypothetical protein